MLRFCVLLLVAVTALAENNFYECGESKYSDAGRGPMTYIIGGQYAREHEFPWTVSLRWKGFNHIHAHTCMGALVREDWVLTAAQCVMATPLKEIVAVMGQHNFYDTAEENPARQELEVEDWFWHDNLAKDNYYEDDIALIKLKGRFTLNENVRTICWPHWEYDYAGETGVVAGWGEQTSGMGDQSPDLKYAVMPIQSNTDCRQVAYRSLTDKMVCAGELDEQQQGPCGGDNGAPLVVYRGRWEVVGLASWAYSCAGGHPFAFTRVSRYQEWVDMIMNDYPNIPNYP